jgi:MtN3 and saliva related transmembrane protein
MENNKSVSVAETFGYLGATCLTISLIPQLAHTIKTKRVADISYGFISLQILTCILFLIYGIMLLENPLIIANGAVFVQLLLFLGLKVKYN